MKILTLLTFLILQVPSYGQNLQKLSSCRSRTTGLFGLCNREGKSIVEPQFCALGQTLNQNYFFVLKCNLEKDKYGNVYNVPQPNNEVWAMLDSLGNMVLGFENKYQNIFINSGGFIEVKKMDLFGMVDFKNKILIPTIYESMLFQNDSVIVKSNNLFGIVNNNNKTLVPIEYESIVITEYCIIAEKNKREGVIDIKNKIIIPFLYDKIFAFGKLFENEKKYSIVEINNKKAVIDFNNKYIVKPTTTNILEIVLNAFIAKKNDKYGLVNLNLKTLIPFEFNHYSIDYNKKFIEFRKTDYPFTYIYNYRGKLIKKQKDVQKEVESK